MEHIDIIKYVQLPTYLPTIHMQSTYHTGAQLFFRSSRTTLVGECRWYLGYTSSQTFLATNQSV